MTELERLAIRLDAAARCVELRRVAAVLIPDADDSVVLSQLTSVFAELRSAEAVLEQQETVR